ncbi:F0F1 ATP synthase subunit B [Aquiluna sp. KACHI24]|uniref:F0F1 ATP synthase subunit B n=1 Tax=Aquiluna sp. KACHI24 TaxID=2968831 RepID=UPI00220BA208|nr:F0F1 ATP synthase subunit B [Aquiluna sp. KACHI24]BDQ00057.1 ATP synthase subunit b [Aquiluna sp. KACHI24]
MTIQILAAAAAEEGATPNPLLPAVYDITWSSVVFVFLLTFFWFKVLPGFKKMLDERAKAIEGRLADAEAAQKAAEERTAAVEAEQEKLRAESSSIREEARAEGAAILAEMKAQASAESERLAQIAKSALEAERESAMNALRNEVGGLAIELASRIVAVKLQDDAIANKVVDDFIAELEAKKA